MPLFLQKEETKATFLLWFIIGLEEDGEVHIHNPKILVHTRTIILLHCTIEMQVAEILLQFFYSRRKFLSI